MKYRRIRTIVTKAVQTVDNCNLQMVLYIYDKSTQRLKEIYSHDNFQREQISQMIESANSKEG